MGSLNFYGYDENGVSLISQKQQMITRQQEIDSRQDEKIKELEDGGGGTTQAYETIDIGNQTNFNGNYPNGVYTINYDDLFNDLKTIWENGKIPIVNFSISMHTANYSVPLFMNDMSNTFCGHERAENGDYTIDVEISSNKKEIITKVIGTYTKPENGIPPSDLDESVQDSLEKITDVTYQELVDMRDSNQLIPGCWYRITDYATTVNSIADSQARSAGHQFDILVLATSVNTLSEEAKAIQHEGDYDGVYVDGGDHCVYTGRKVIVHFADVNKELYLWHVVGSDYSEYEGYYSELSLEELKPLTQEELNETLWVWVASYSVISENEIDADFAYDGNVDTFASAGFRYSFNSYFSNSNLNAWKLWYCLDSDNSRFAWADGGKGVIYRMIDEWNNDCPYDFKNIKFLRYKITNCPKSPDLVGKYSVNDNSDITVDTSTEYYVYTFSVIDNEEDDVVDVSVFSHKYGNDEGGYTPTTDNKIKEFYDIDENGNYIMKLPNNVFVTDTDIIDDYGGFIAYYSNTFGNSCNRNTFGNYCGYNTFGNGCYSNTFGNDCWSNTFGNYCQGNTFGNDCQGNTFGNGCYYNTFGNNCGSNTFGNDCWSNTFGNDCWSNTFGNDCGSNTFGNASTTQSYFRWIIFDSGNQNINLFYDGTLSSSIQCQNVHILHGVNNSNTKKDVELEIVNQQYQIFVGLKTNGTLVMYNPLDYINT